MQCECVIIGSWHRDACLSRYVAHTCEYDRHIKHHSQTFTMHIRYGNYFLLVYLWQGIAIGLDVTCPTRVRSQTNINHSRIRIKMPKYSIIRVNNLSAVPEVCKDLVRSLGRDYGVYSIQSKDSNRTAREIVLSSLSDGAAWPTVTDINK